MRKRQRNAAPLTPCPQPVPADVQAVGPFQRAAMHEYFGEVGGVFERIEQPPGFRINPRFEIEGKGFSVLECDFENESLLHSHGSHLLQFVHFKPSISCKGSPASAL